MAIPVRPNINSLEKAKFKECDGEIAVRTSLCGTAAFSPSGLKNGGLITEVALNDSTWTAIPATALADRNAISIQNPSDINIKINYDNTVSGFVGMLVAPGSERYYDITDAIVLYAKSESGTPTVNVEEIS